MKTETQKTAGDLTGPILAMMESWKAQRTTPQRSLAPREREKLKRRWLDKWLPMKLTHPQVQAARDALWRMCSGYGKNPTRGKTFVLFGENGSGKTRLAKQVSRWA